MTVTRQCPVCGQEIELLADEFQVEFIHEGHSVRIDGKAYCDRCDENYYGSYLVEVSGDDFDSWMWD